MCTWRERPAGRPAAARGGAAALACAATPGLGRCAACGSGSRSSPSASPSSWPRPWLSGRGAGGHAQRPSWLGSRRPWCRRTSLPSTTRRSPRCPRRCGATSTASCRRSGQPSSACASRTQAPSTWAARRRTGAPSRLCRRCAPIDRASSGTRASAWRQGCAPTCTTPTSRAKGCCTRRSRGSLR